MIFLSENLILSISYVTVCNFWHSELYVRICTKFIETFLDVCFILKQVVISELLKSLVYWKVFSLRMENLSQHFFSLHNIMYIIFYI